MPEGVGVTLGAGAADEVPVAEELTDGSDPVDCAVRLGSESGRAMKTPAVVPRLRAATTESVK
jgi:hypothetical protein